MYNVLYLINNNLTQWLVIFNFSMCLDVSRPTHVGDDGSTIMFSNVNFFAGCFTSVVFILVRLDDQTAWRGKLSFFALVFYFLYYQ